MAERARRLLGRMNRREVQQKIILGGVALILLGAIEFRRHTATVESTLLFSYLAGAGKSTLGVVIRNPPVEFALTGQIFSPFLGFSTVFVFF